MTTALHPDPLEIRDRLASLAEAAISGDVLTGEGGGFVTVMAKSHPHVRQDIAAAFEMYTLLIHYLGKLPVRTAALDAPGDVVSAAGAAPSPLALTPGIAYDEATNRVVALVPVDAGTLEMVAHWVTEGMRSDTVKRMGGLLALPFSIETHDDRQHLIPEWFAAFYVDASEAHCVPVLTLKSFTCDDRIGDWVAVALERMALFALPCEAARKAAQHLDKSTSS